jgi:glucose-1-phosphate cytidylyltransferase
MKVVLFCGGEGLRLHPSTESLPKPLTQVGGKPLLLLLMKYYSYFGYNEFILCLGYKGDEVKQYFLHYDECPPGDFVLSRGRAKQRLSKSDVEDWTITFADTGLAATVSQRLQRVKKYLEGEEAFLANYADGLTDMYLPDLVTFFTRRKKTACLVTVKPSLYFHAVTTGRGDCVEKVVDLGQTGLRINGGFFIFTHRIFEHLKPGEDLVPQTFQRLIQKRELVAYPYDGFWASLDTYKDKQRLDALAAEETPIWEIWDRKRPSGKRAHARTPAL